MLPYFRRIRRECSGQVLEYTERESDSIFLEHHYRAFPLAVEFRKNLHIILKRDQMLGFPHYIPCQLHYVGIIIHNYKVEQN